MLSPESAPRDRLLPPRPVASALIMLMFTGVLWAIEGVDTVVGGALDEDGIWPRDPHHLDGVLWAPLLHKGWEHLEANTLPFLLFGFLAMAGGVGEWLLVTAVIWLLGGFGVWLIGAPGITIGASGVIFGWLVFLLVRGFFTGSMRQIVLAGVLFFFWGGVLWGVLPSQPDVSWQAHLCGAGAGLFAARILGRPRQRGPRWA